MLAQRAQPQTQYLQFIVLEVQRVGDWFIRECPDCHRVGYVSIYPNREAEVMAYIMRTNWTCKPCADIQREVDRNFNGRGGDALVH